MQVGTAKSPFLLSLRGFSALLQFFAGLEALELLSSRCPWASEALLECLCHLTREAARSASCLCQLTALGSCALPGIALLSITLTRVPVKSGCVPVPPAPTAWTNSLCTVLSIRYGKPRLYFINCVKLFLIIPRRVLFA